MKENRKASQKTGNLIAYRETENIKNARKNDKISLYPQ